MTRFVRKTGKKAGAAPGTLDTALTSEIPNQIRITAFSEKEFEEIPDGDMAQAQARINGRDTVWVHVCGLSDAALLQQAGQRFNIHALTLEDIANTGHRPKFEDFDDHFFMVLKQLAYNSEETILTAGQISLVAMENLVISFQEYEDGSLEPVRRRLRSGRGRIRTSGAGYLAYAILDAVVDHYFHVLGDMGDDIESLEGLMLEGMEAWHLEEIHRLKRETIFFHKQVWPLREALNRLMKSDSPLLPETTGRFISDVNDHLILILDTIDSFRELTASMLDLYMTAMGDRMNQVMKTLTIIATIFIPLTFLAGIYGMNFKYMPELDWKWGYFGLLGLMAVMGLAMLLFFKRKKWF